MKLSIIIVHHQTPELLRLCLKSLKNFVVPDISCEIIVIDSQTQRVGQDVIYEDFPDMNINLLTHKDNLGYARGVNAGIKASNGEYILILNPDISVTKKGVGEMVNYMENNPQAGILGPQLLDFNGDIQRSYFRFYTPLTIIARRTFIGRLPFFKNIIDNFIMSDSDPKKIQYPDWIMGSALMISRKAIKKVGLMDERFFLYFEDVDWARRFWENGYSVTYLPEVKMYHYHQRKSKAGFGIFDLFIRKEARWHIKSAVKYFIKHGVRNKINKHKRQTLRTKYV